MSTSNRAVHDAKVSELAREYASKGYEVFRDPETSLFPFDTFGYRPDLLARKGDENVMVEVKSTATGAPIDRFVELVEEVQRHETWDFVLVTFEDVEVAPIPEGGDALPTWDQLRDRIGRAERLLRAKEAEAAFLSLWIALEGMLRREARESALPIDRLPTSGLIDYLQTYGVLSYAQHESAMALLEVRNRVVHGFQTDDLAEVAPRLLGFVRELIAEWAASRQAA